MRRTVVMRPVLLGGALVEVKRFDLREIADEIEDEIEDERIEGEISTIESFFLVAIDMSTHQVEVL